MINFLIKKVKSEGIQTFIAIGSVSIGVLYALLKLLRYTYWSGYFKVFEINRDLIDLNNTNVIFDIIVIVIVFFTFETFVGISYDELIEGLKDIKLENTGLKRVVLIFKKLPINICLAYMYTLMINLPAIIAMSIGSTMSFKQGFFCSVMFFLAEMVIGYVKNKERKNKEITTNEEEMELVLEDKVQRVGWKVVSFILMSFLCFFYLCIRCK